MKLVIKDIEHPVITEFFNDAVNMIETKLRGMKIDYKRMLDRDNKMMVFTPVKTNKLFLSSVENKIVLKAGDSRIKKLGRDYLVTHSLTEEQYDKMVDAVVGTFNKLGATANVNFHEFDDESSFIKIREGNKVVGKLPRPTSFPKKG